MIKNVIKAKVDVISSYVHMQAIGLREYDISELVNLQNHIGKAQTNCKAQTRRMHIKCKASDSVQCKFPH